MDELFLEFPTLEREKDAVEYIEEFHKYGSQINGTGSLNRGYLDYSKWIKKINDDLNEETVEEGKVPAHTFFVVRKEDNRIVGMVNIRHRIDNDYLLRHGGHIGDSVRPTERCKRYATQAIHLALEKCQELGIKKALVTCDKENVGSAKSIKNNWGVLENEVLEEDEKTILQRYWIDVDDSLKKGIAQPVELKNKVVKKDSRDYN